MTKLLFELHREHRLAELAQQYKYAVQHHDISQIISNDASMAIFETSLQSTEKILFAESATKMLYDILGNKIVHEDYAATITQEHNIWIEFNAAFILPKYPDLNIAAMMFVKLYDFEAISKVNKSLALNLYEAMAHLDKLYALDCIDPNGDPVFSLIWHPEHHWNFFSEFHDCPFQQCQRNGKILIPCLNCKSLKAYWSMSFAVSLLLKEQFFAQEKTEQYTALRRVPRKDNPKKHRTINVSHVFRVIDASTKTIREVQETMFPRGSWLAMHQENEIVYIDQTVKRTYRHERYKNVRGTTQEVVQHRPVLKDNISKQVTKVVASEYEKKEKSS